MSPREQRVIRNASRLREVNAHIAGLEERASGSRESLELICECAQRGCLALIEVDPATFEDVRRKPGRFFVVPGHERPEVESVVERHSGYLIVEKHGD